MPITDRDMRDQVKYVLAGDVAGYDVGKIVDDLQGQFGTVDVSSIDPRAFWATVERHAR